MRINKFIKKLNKLYRPIKSKQFLVKYWAQPTSFSFAVYQTGGGGGNALNFMEIMGAKAAKDLSLELKNK